MSTEQCQGQPVDLRADVYVLRVIMYELVSGALPFWGNGEEAREAHRGQPPRALLNVGCPPKLDAVVRRCLAKSPAERCPSLGELRCAVQAAFDEVRASWVPAHDEEGLPNLPMVEWNALAELRGLPTDLLLVASLSAVLGEGFAVHELDAVVGRLELQPAQGEVWLDPGTGPAVWNRNAFSGQQDGHTSTVSSSSGSFTCRSRQCRADGADTTRALRA